MIELLGASYFPVEWRGKTFIDTFDSMLDGAQEISIATGYCSEESIAKLVGLYEKEYSAHLELIIGMHYFEGFTQAQYDGLKYLNEILQKGERGCVYLANRTKYHGKIYLVKYFQNKYKSIVGSSNISKLNIMERVFDNDVFTDEIGITKPLKTFFSELRDKNCISLQDVRNEDVKIQNDRKLFENYLDVKKISDEKLASLKVLAEKSKKVFEIPLKTEEKSNLNVFFGKGRENTANGITLPRDWYEVELIVPKSITGETSYPQKREFTVYTDDGFTFQCKTSGDYSKNLRSAKDLRILGKWLKGRLENAGSLISGKPVTESVLSSYGRNTMKMIRLNENEWFLDFGV
ncbi:MAG: NgoFVII family restriction endonuclease [Fibrobacter sp.]|nr:NgoFVII family restriction endonuclease [Fibrobacter sp.]